MRWVAFGVSAESKNSESADARKIEATSGINTSENFIVIKRCSCSVEDETENWLIGLCYQFQIEYISEHIFSIHGIMLRDIYLYLSKHWIVVSLICMSIFITFYNHKFSSNWKWSPIKNDFICFIRFYLEKY